MNKNRIFDREETPEAYELRVAYMQQIQKIWKWESSAKAHIYLSIKGKMKLEQLNSILGLKGEKSIYRTIKPLVDNGLIAKEEDPNNKREPWYYVTGESINDPLFTKGFMEYLASQKRFFIISDYLNLANKGSITFISVMTEILQNIFVKKKIDTNILGNSLFFEGIFSHNNPKELARKLNQFIKDEITPLVSLKKDFKQPLENPVGLYMAFLPFANND